MTASQPPSAPSADRVLPFAVMLRASLIPMACTAPIIVLVFWVSRQARGGLAASLGVLVAGVFFASGLLVMNRVTNAGQAAMDNTANPVNPANPGSRASPASQLTVLAGALAVYFGQVIFLGVIIIILSGADWLDGTAFGLSVLAVALIWQLTQVTAFLRLRKPVYDQPPVEQTVGWRADERAEKPSQGPPI